MQRRLLFPAVAVFSDLFAWSDIMFFFVVRAGLGKGETVTLMLPNRADFYVPVLAAWRCGAAVSLVDPLQQPGRRFQPGRNFGRLGRKNVKVDKTVAEFCKKNLQSAKKLVLSIP
jgi:acyl-coenzyme A synthetase/AMP-(fatty) acid ligase